MDNREKFLEELKSQYEKEFEIKNSLESKANYNLASSGIVVGLLFTFAFALLDSFKATPNLQCIIALLLISIGLFVTSILFSVLALRIKHYYFSFLPNYFYADKDNFDEQKVNEYKYMHYNKFLNKIIDIYLRANRHNFTENEKKATFIEIAHWFFFGGISLVLLTVLVFSLTAILN